MRKKITLVLLGAFSSIFTTSCIKEDMSMPANFKYADSLNLPGDKHKTTHEERSTRLDNYNFNQTRNQ